MSVVREMNGYHQDLTSSALLSKYNQNIDLTLKIIDIHQLAIKNYLNKNFIKSWELVEEIFKHNDNNIDNELLIKVYKLYLSLYDLLLKGKFNIDNKNELVYKFQDGGLYKEVEQSQLQDSELYLMTFIIERSNQLDLSVVLSQIEQCLMQLSHMKIIELYVFNVLPNLGQYSKAHSAIDKYLFREDDDLKLKYHNKLKQVKKDIERKEKEKKEKKEQKEKEKEKTITPPPPLEVETETEIAKTVSQPERVNTRSISIFRKILKRYRQQNKNIFMILFMVIAFLISYRKNRSLLLSTLKMIFKVSYI